MATAKYKAESPFVKQAERNHHKSDFLYDRYKELIPSILILVFLTRYRIHIIIRCVYCPGFRKALLQLKKGSFPMVLDLLSTLLFLELVAQVNQFFQNLR